MYKILKNALSLDECEFIFSEFEKLEKKSKEDLEKFTKNLLNS